MARPADPCVAALQVGFAHDEAEPRLAPQPVVALVVCCAGITCDALAVDALPATVTIVDVGTLELV